MVDAARQLAASRPLLLIIDEFGKNLESIREGGDSDPYLLQQLAEAGQGSGLLIFVVTLQHLSFEDSLSGVSAAQRREWTKVQGRFEDVSFTESAAQTRALISTVFTVTDNKLKDRIDRWAKSLTRGLRTAGVSDLGDAESVAACYPLHPVVALVLPELCNRYGQHERTLFSFLAGAHPAGVASFLRRTNLPPRCVLPSLGLEPVYDYFVGSGALSISSARESSRWSEIATRVRDSQGLTVPQSRMAKTIALLNLVSTSGTLRASRQLLRLCETRTGITDKTLSQLQSSGLVTYRDFADEYRIWHGSDIDIGVLLDSARQRARTVSLAEIAAEIETPSPIVAARHSAQNDVLRIFDCRYARSAEAVEPPGATSPYDGLVLLVTDSSPELPVVAHHESVANTKPVVAAVPTEIEWFDAAAREVAAMAYVLDDDEVLSDRVARRELSERQAQARAEFDRAAIDCFRSDSCDWVLLGCGDSEAGELKGGRGSAAVSDAADEAYPNTPPVGNEMLNRCELTSQGSRARRVLIEAMIERGGEEVAELGFKGYGPEVAMYRAFLARTGIHISYTAAGSSSVAGPGFRRPTDNAVQPAWDVMERIFKGATSNRVNLSDVNASLMSPPIGMKAAAVPVLVVAGLLAFRDEVAIYEHGTFKPHLSPQVAERLVRNPSHFDIKHFANTTGGRLAVIEALGTRLGLASDTQSASRSKRRVANVLSVVANLVLRVNRLENYSRRTSRLSAPALAVRKALLKAVEPDKLLFSALPGALEFPTVPAGVANYEHADELANALVTAMAELETCFERLLEDLTALVLQSSATTSRKILMGEAAALDYRILDPHVRAFVLALGNDSAPSDAAWVSAIATVVTRKAPAEWTDHDLRRFRRELPEQLAAFYRLVALRADRRATGGTFDALRVTVTRPDGSEYIRLVGIDDAERSAVTEALDTAADQLAIVLGSQQRAHQGLLAVLSERLMPRREPDEVPSVTRSTQATQTSRDLRSVTNG